MGEAAFTFVDEVEWFIATVTRQNYNSKSQIIHRSSAGTTVMVALDPAPVSAVPAPTNLRVQDWDTTRGELAWENPTPYSKVLVGWSSPPGASHHQLDDLPGNTTSAFISA